MAEVTDILLKYTNGEATIEETNDALKGSGLILISDRNVLTEEEIAATTVGATPAEANGYGLLDIGVGGMEKVKVVNGTMVGCDMGESYAIMFIGGKKYFIDGDKLTDTKPADPVGKPKLPIEPDMSRKPDMANLKAEQRTQRGTFIVYYDENGYATKAVRKDI